MRSVLPLLLALPLATPSLAQAPPASLPPPVLLYSAVYLGDPGLQAELKLPRAQADKLPRMLFDFHRALANARLGPKQRDERTAHVQTKLAEALDADQRARLRQVTLQHLARIRHGGPTLAADEALAKALKLTDAQKKQLGTHTPLAKVLSADQQKRWRELTGAPYRARLLMRGIEGVAYPLMPVELRALLSDPYEHDLRLTEKQQDEIDEVAGRYHDLFPAKTWDEAKALTPELTRAARAVLTPAQSKRLDQLLLWQAGAAHGSGQALLAPEVAKALKLSPKTQAALAKVRADRTKELAAIYTSGKELAAIKELAAKHQAQTPATMRSALAPEERKLADELLGPPPAAPLPRTVGPRYPFFLLPEGPRLFLASMSMRLAQAPILHKELGLDAEQIKKVKAVQARVEAGPPKPGAKAEQKRREEAEAVEREMSALLKPAQWRRWKELTFRDLSLGGFFTGGALLQVEEFHKGLGLSPAQARRLRRGAALFAVLDEKQQAKWKKMLGESPFRPGPRPPLVAVYGVAEAQLRYLTDPGGQAELKLSEEQKKALAALAAKVRPTFPKLGFSIAEWSAKIEKRSAEVLPEALKLLDKKQASRLRQLGLQFQQSEPTLGILPLLDLKLVSAELKMTAKQRADLDQLVEEGRELFQLLAQVPLGRDAMRARGDLGRSIDTRARALLTEEQRTRLREMLGEPYRGPQLRPARDGFVP